MIAFLGNRMFILIKVRAGELFSKFLAKKILTTTDAGAAGVYPGPRRGFAPAKIFLPLSRRGLTPANFF